MCVLGGGSGIPLPPNTTPFGGTTEHLNAAPRFQAGRQAGNTRDKGLESRSRLGCKAKQWSPRCDCLRSYPPSHATQCLDNVILRLSTGSQVAPFLALLERLP